MIGLHDSHALVTGGATGIGLAIARLLAEKGARVTVASRNKKRIDEVTRIYPGLKGIVLDVTDAQSVTAAFELAGPVDILINNAGVAVSAPFERTSLEQLEFLISVNLVGVFLCTQAVLPSMRQQNRGRIINISSTAGLRGYPYTSAYAASKHAVIGLTRSLALELSRTNITANCVCPGYTDTEIFSRAVANITQKTGMSADEAMQALVGQNPQQRLIPPEEVADTVVWLCGRGSQSINGQAIAVAGGEVM